MPNIAFIPLLFTQVSFSCLPKSYRQLKNLIYFHTVYTRVFSSGVYRYLDSTRFFSTAIFLGERKIAPPPPQLGLGFGLGQSSGRQSPGGNFPNTKVKYALDF